MRNVQKGFLKHPSGTFLKLKIYIFQISETLHYFKLLEANWSFRLATIQWDNYALFSGLWHAQDKPKESDVSL